MIERARQLRRAPTLFERRLWRQLRIFNAQGFHFRRQARFRNYILDFVEHRTRVVVELDGDQHGEDTNRSRDAVRDALLASEGYLVLRFWNEDLKDNFEGAAQAINRAIQRLSPTRDRVPRSRPPHKGAVVD